MNCEQAREDFSALLDGELTGQARAAVDGHLSECADCLRHLDRLHRVNVIYAGLATQDAPDHFVLLVRQSVRREKRRAWRARLRPLALWPSLAAAAVLLMVGGLAVLRMQPAAERFSVAQLSEYKTVSRALSAKDVPAEKPAPPVDEDVKMQMEALGYYSMEKAQGGGAVENVGEVSLGRAAEQPVAATADVRQEIRGDFSRAEAPRTAAPEAIAGVTETQEQPPKPAARESADAPQEALLAYTPSDAASSASAAEKGVRETVPAVKVEAVSTKQVGRRTFVLDNGVWREKGYAGEQTVRVPRGSAALEDLLKRDAELTEALRLGESVLFKCGDTWYEVTKDSTGAQ